MIKKKDYIILLILLVTIFILILNLRNYLLQGTIKNEFDMLNEKYIHQKNINEYQILYKKLSLSEGFNFYNPCLKSYNSDTIRLTKLIKSKALVFRFTISSCTSCIENKIDYYLENQDSIKYQFIVICTDEQVFNKFSRIYKYKNLNFYLVEKDEINHSKFNISFSSLYFIVDKRGKIITTILPDNIEEFYDLLNIYL